MCVDILIFFDIFKNNATQMRIEIFRISDTLTFFFNFRHATLIHMNIDGK